MGTGWGSCTLSRCRRHTGLVVMFSGKHASRVFSTLRKLIGRVRVPHSGLVAHPSRLRKRGNERLVHDNALPPKIGPALPDPRGTAIKFL